MIHFMNINSSTTNKMLILTLFFIGFSTFVQSLQLSFDATFRSILTQFVNPIGIKIVSGFVSIPTSYFALELSPNSNVGDYTILALNETIANCNLIDDSNGGGQCISSTNQPASFLIDCTISQNAQNQANFILINFQQSNFASFQAFGDAKASFYSGPSWFIGNENTVSIGGGQKTKRNEVSTSTTTTTTTTTAESLSESSIDWSQQATSDQPNPTVLVSCPPTPSSSSSP